jgi:hypothetical protein
MRTRVALAALGIATTALVGVAVLTPVGAASAASVKSVLLGKTNKTSTTTTVQNSKGTALSLKAPKDKAPLAVSNSVTVKNLSADRLDGLSSGSFARSTGRTGTIAVAPRNLAGMYQAICPSGTVVTGGGGISKSGLTFSARAIDPVTSTTLNGWEAYPLDSSEEDFIVIAECYSPSGKPVPGSLEADAAAGKLTAADRTLLTKRSQLARR